MVFVSIVFSVTILTHLLMKLVIAIVILTSCLALEGVEDEEQEELGDQVSLFFLNLNAF